MTDSAGAFGRLDGKSSMLFLTAGTVFLATAANNGAIFFVDGYDNTSLTIGLLAVGLLAAVIGLIGLYPTLADRTPRLAKLGVAVTVLATIDVFVLVAWGIADTVSLAPAPSPIVVVTTPILMLLGFFLFGVAILRTDVYPGPVGLLLLAQVVALIALIAIPALLFEGEAPIWGSALIEGVQAAILLGIGTLLGRNASSPDRGGSTASERSIS